MPIESIPSSDSWSTISTNTPLHLHKQHPQSALPSARTRTVAAAASSSSWKRMPDSMQRQPVPLEMEHEIISTSSSTGNMSWTKRIPWLTSSQQHKHHQQRREEKKKRKKGRDGVVFSSSTTSTTNTRCHSPDKRTPLQPALPQLPHSLDYQTGEAVYYGGPLEAALPQSSVKNNIKKQDNNSRSRSVAFSTTISIEDPNAAPLVKTSSFQRIADWFRGGGNSNNDGDEGDYDDYGDEEDVNSDASPIDFREEDWTPPDSSYGAAIPVGGCIPKNIRRLIEWTLMGGVILSLVFFIISTSIRLSEDDSTSSSNGGGQDQDGGGGSNVDGSSSNNYYNRDDDTSNYFGNNNNAGGDDNSYNMYSNDAKNYYAFVDDSSSSSSSYSSKNRKYNNYAYNQDDTYNNRWLLF